MRNVHGVCPECYNRITIDLDAAVVECPICHRRLKMKKAVNKTEAAPKAATPIDEPLSVPAEVAQQAARETIVGNEKTEPIEEVTNETQAVVPEEPVPEEIPAEVPAEEEPVAEEPAAEEAPAEEAPAEEEAMSEEEAMALAAALDEGVDDLPVTTEPEAESAEEAPAEEAPAEEPDVDPDEISPEELALMDDVPPQEAVTPEDEPVIYSSISAEEEAPEPEEEEETEEPQAEEEELGEGMKELGDEQEDGDLSVEDEDAEFAMPTEPAAEEPVAEEPIVEEPVAEETAEETAEEKPAEEAAEETPAEEVTEPAPEAVEEAATEEAAPEPVPVEVEEPVAEEVAAAPAEAAAEGSAEEDLGYSEEDFAAAGEMDVRSAPARTYIAPKHTPVVRPNQERQAKAETPKAPVERESIYAKPVAVIIAVLSLFLVLFEFTYGAFIRNSVLPESITQKILDILPTFAGGAFSYILTGAFYGIIALIAIFAISGKRGRVASIVLLLATVLLGLVQLWTLHDGAFFFIPFDGLSVILEKFGSYILAGGYALILVAGILYVASFLLGKQDYKFSILTGIITLLYVLVLMFAGVAQILLPEIIDPILTTEVIEYAIVGVVGITVLLTLIGVHRGDLSRSSNGFLTANLFIAFGVLAVLSAVLPNFIGIGYLFMGSLSEAVAAALPIGALAFALSDLRN